MLELIKQNALELEMSARLVAEPYERNGDRTGYRSGHRPRVFTARVGDLELLVPQDRDGMFSTMLFERFGAKRESAGALHDGDVRAGGINPQGGRHHRVMLSST